MVKMSPGHVETSELCTQRTEQGKIRIDDDLKSIEFFLVCLQEWQKMIDDKKGRFDAEPH